MKFESSSAISKGLGNALETIADVGSLPAIRGRWYFVDPKKGADTSGGKSIDTALASIEEAYDRVLDGDGIALLSYGSASADSTSYLKAELTWKKDGITVFGVCAPITYTPRGRVANKKVTTTADMTVAAGALKIITRAAGSFIEDGWEIGMTALTAGNQATSSVVTAVAALSLTVTDELVASDEEITSVTSTMVNLITLSGDNNRFYNMSFWNGGTSDTEIGGIYITGSRNYFNRCHIVGAAGATPAATHYSLKIETGKANFFEDCIIGINTIVRGNNADAEIVFKGEQSHNRFLRCEVMSYVPVGTAHAAIKSDTTASGRGAMFQDCVFNSLDSADTPAAAHIFSTSSCPIAMKGCACYNFTAWGAYVYVDNAATASSAAGGLATVAT